MKLHSPLVHRGSSVRSRMNLRQISTLLLLQVLCLPSQAHLCHWCRDPPGHQGLKGRKGSPGPTGKSGSAGAKGPPGSKGARGPPGIGIQGQIGPPGPQGKSGNNGAQGPPGIGIQGQIGPPGPQGKSGNNGAQGPPGIGIQGQIGPPGPQGKSGNNGAQGPPGPMGPPGVPGPDYNATWFALLGACQKQRRIPTLIDGAGYYDQTHYDDEVVRQKCENFTATAFEQLQAFIKNPIDPERRKNITFKTCRDLFIANPDKCSGEYRIDPNDGDDHDAIWVYCDAEKRSTCITPDPDRSPNITYAGEKREVWLSEIEHGMQITYNADSSQIAALQSASIFAEQTVTYHCLKSVGYFDTVGQTYDRGLKLSAWTEVEITPRGRQRLRYDVISDECQDRLNEWRKTVITYRTDKPVLLPVVDVALRDVMGPGKSFSVEIGQVCFI